MAHIIVAIVLAARGQTVTENAGVKLVGECNQIEVELLAGEVGIGIHVEIERTVARHKVLEQLAVGLAEECGRGYGYCLVPRGEHRPTVACALGDEEWFALAEHSQYRQVIDAAFCALGKSESRLLAILDAVVEIAVLYAHQPSRNVVVGYLEPVGAALVAPTGESAPTHYARVELALVEEKSAGRLRQFGMLEEAYIPLGVEGGRLADTC